ncbi:MAG TPA: transglycosylase SLT domain-containing protein [Burkholderiales bacterium]|nr:transglycosylase SLT domain-containing protein [Burkholderiales bacterium]
MKLPALGLALGILAPATALAGAQIYEPLAAEVRAGLQASIADKPAQHAFKSAEAAVDWLTEMSQRLEPRIPNFDSRVQFLRTVHYEATHAKIDPQLVLALIQVESNFRKYAVSRSGARGYMQVMPFWVGLIGRPGDNLFSLRNNLRYGCVILKYYLDAEKGDVPRALARYNGSPGKSDYPSMVIGAWRSTWHYQGRLTLTPIHAGNTLAMVDCIACAAASGSAAWRMGRPTTM